VATVAAIQRSGAVGGKFELNDILRYTCADAAMIAVEDGRQLVLGDDLIKLIGHAFMRAGGRMPPLGYERR